MADKIYHVQMPKASEKYIEAKLEAGEFASANELIRSAVRLVILQDYEYKAATSGQGRNLLDTGDLND